MGGSKYFAKALFTLAILAGLAAPAFACMWDVDTLMMERQRFPDALELITGKFLRHTPEYYQWRIKDRTARLKSEPENLAIYDDLAVAYDKTGQQDKAIETMLAKEKLKPGLYETAANLGTFYIHAGQLEKGLDHIERAIEINPDAHFGREIYQKRLVEYVLSKRKDGKLSLPLDSGDRTSTTTNDDGEEIVREYRSHGARDRGSLVFLTPTDDARIDEEELDKALQGVLGMMRFGHYDSPVLLEVVGDLLRAREHPGDANRLAARAYLKASYETKDAAVKKKYRELAGESLLMQLGPRIGTDSMTVDEVEQYFATELAEAEAWYAEVAADEQAWIAAGEDVDARFAEKYYQQPAVTLSVNEKRRKTPDEFLLTALLIAGSVFLTVLIAFIVAIFFAIRWWKRRKLRLASIAT